MSSKSALCAVCLALFGSSRAYAGDEDRTILLLLKDVPGAPTPAEVVSYANTWPHAANPPLQSFLVKDPSASGWLMEDRATGDFLAWLQANPSSARRKLEDYALMLYPSPADIPAALAALQAICTSLRHASRSAIRAQDWPRNFIVVGQVARHAARV